MAARRALFACLLSGLLLALPWRAAAQAPGPALDRAAIDRYVAQVMEADRVPGVAIAIVYQGQIVYERGYGSDGYGRPVTPATGFVLGSISKSFTALAIMQLVERGLVGLDTPVQQYLPWFRVADPQASAIITVRHLLTHTSGIPPRAPQAAGAATLQDHVRALADTALSHPPGARHDYASPNYQVLGAILEQVAGRSYARYIQEEIFDPLGMTQSFTDQAAARSQGMARGHRYWFGWPIGSDRPHEADRLPTAALISSAHDLGTYLRAQLGAGGGRELLSPAGIAMLHQPHAPGEGFAYGFGWRISPIGGAPAVHHGGIVPDFRGKLVLLPEQGWGVAVMTNASTSLPLPQAPSSHLLADTIAASLVGRPLAPRPVSQSAAYLAVTIGAALVLLSQLRGLGRRGRGRWRDGAAAWSRRRMVLAVLGEAAWPALGVSGLPILLGMPWPAIVDGTPDMALWLLLSAALGLLTAAWKLRTIRRLWGGATG